MKQLFSTLYNKLLQWSEHRHAPYYLAGVSIAESSVFPIPPDVMLIPMGLAKPQHIWRYATLTTVCSVIGGIIGYFLGFFLIELIMPWIEYVGYGPTYAKVHELFQQWGFWIVFMAGFSPIPYKLFTIGAGAIHMAFMPFFIASLIGRAARFFLVSAILYYAGERLKNILPRIVNGLGWFVVVVLVAYFLYKLI